MERVPIPSEEIFHSPTLKNVVVATITTPNNHVSIAIQLGPRNNDYVTAVIQAFFKGHSDNNIVDLYTKDIVETCINHKSRGYFMSGDFTFEVKYIDELCLSVI